MINPAKLKDGDFAERFAERLLRFTEKCRDDMHEPDEQDISAAVIGDHLDNAMGDTVNENAIIEGYQEFVVLLRSPGFTERFNLSTLIAFARIGAEAVIASSEEVE